ncbi:hypothetical protein SEPCBS57363_004346 [Sporothrix epigloea]|uniref:Mucin-7 n=1 Tax=Sporothrix epigloea TaxID=1892477 RepID=A0ABP0DRI5_9PEZI
MSQVKNLRAMFETKGDSSPPDRGRTQQGLSAQPSESPRPLSRVRASFVTVEKDGRLGLQRDTSSDSIPTLSRTISNATESDIAAVAQDRSESPPKVDDPRLSVAVQVPKRMPAPIPEEAMPVTPPNTKAQPPAQIKVSAPTPTSSALRTPGRTSPSKSIETKMAQNGGGSLPSPRKVLAKPLGGTESLPTSGASKLTAKAPANEEAASSKPKSKIVTAAGIPPRGVKNGAAKASSIAAKSTSSSSTQKHRKETSSTIGGKDAHHPTAITKSVPKAISTAKANAKPATYSSGLIVKTPRTPITPRSPTGWVKLAANQCPAEPSNHKALPATDKSTASRMPASADSKTAAAKSSITTMSTKPNPAPLPTFPTNGIGFVKPKPRSPTRPVPLPSSLTTHTASSATKVNVPRQSLSRQSGNFLTLHPPTTTARSASRASVSTVGTAAFGSDGRQSRRQSSTVNRSRPSIGPPPKQATRDHSVTKWEKEVDEGFLARMMRPTQASSLKTADKVHVSSPPRKQLATTTTKKSGAFRESLPLSVKMSVSMPLSLPPYPPACITRKPSYPTILVEEESADAPKIVELTKRDKDVSEPEATEPVLERAATANEATEETPGETAEETDDKSTDNAVHETVDEDANDAPNENVNEDVNEDVNEAVVDAVGEPTLEAADILEKLAATVEGPAESIEEPVETLGSDQGTPATTEVCIEEGEVHEDEC